MFKNVYSASAPELGVVKTNKKVSTDNLIIPATVRPSQPGCVIIQKYFFTPLA